ARRRAEHQLCHPVETGGPASVAKGNAAQHRRPGVGTGFQRTMNGNNNCVALASCQWSGGIPAVSDGTPSESTKAKRSPLPGEEDRFAPCDLTGRAARLSSPKSGQRRGIPRPRAGCPCHYGAESCTLIQKAQGACSFGSIPFGGFMLRLALLAAFFSVSLLLPYVAPAADAPAAAKPDWTQILGAAGGAAQGSLPVPQTKVVWRDNLEDAMAQAKAENRPLFVTLRCLPCKQCSAFDKDVLEGGPELDPLLKQFITVRLISAKSLDFRIFPAEGFQDMDLSWWGYFLSPEGKIYGIFGGRDEVSD